MFQSKAYIERRNGRSGTDRKEYLQKLVQEYKTTDNLEAKKQILANLANFAYDPVNYEWLWDLNVVNLFLTAITDADPLLREYGMGGLANICLDPRHRAHITSESYYIRAIQACIDADPSTHTENTMLNAMLTLIFTINPACQSAILTTDLREQLQRIHAADKMTRKSCMAKVFLTDYFREEV
ncbi:uncharacterized protein BYT42DRAFT_609619 [Radiomyces spectabilis]|uniref:uncharacterized protein n=1 Tax=Radiomyces spectabilis TaxID=64574 RepID=UPI00221F2639|nr:uncharacterized protein BYT42DRAFT_609619 [Radiomyces spectabilis]KAI8393854.1 hypothetical protein BYT42DRAFT_609619 [Radiomyces spectabilis]